MQKPVGDWCPTMGFPIRVSDLFFVSLLLLLLFWGGVQLLVGVTRKPKETKRKPNGNHVQACSAYTPQACSGTCEVTVVTSCSKASVCESLRKGRVKVALAVG